VLRRSVGGSGPGPGPGPPPLPPALKRAPLERLLFAKPLDEEAACAASGAEEPKRAESFSLREPEEAAVGGRYLERGEAAAERVGAALTPAAAVGDAAALLSLLAGGLPMAGDSSIGSAACDPLLATFSPPLAARRAASL